MQSNGSLPPSGPTIISSGIEAALAAAFGDHTRAARQEFDLIEAKAAALIAETQARLMTIEMQCRDRLVDTEARCASLEAAADARIAERLDMLRDGADGLPGEPGPAGDAVKGDAGEKGDPGEPGEPGPAGKDADEETIARSVLGLLPPKDELRGPEGPQGGAGPAGEPGPAGRDADEAAIVRSVLGSLPSADELRGEPGQPGEPGRLGIVKGYVDGAVTYAGECVAHRGATWQAIRDTGREPGGDDWVCLAERGVDGRSPAVRGTWEEGKVYEEKDVAIVGGSSFIAKHDDPGPCPGDGWQLLASRGKTGEPGRPGATGAKGDPGPPGPAPLALTIESDTVLTITLADGQQLAVDLYELLARR